MFARHDSNHHADRRLTAACLCVLLAAPLTAVAQGGNSDYISVERINDIDLGTWTGVGGLSSGDTSCLASANTNSGNPKPGDNVMPYQVKVESSDLAAGDFYLYLNGNTANTGNKRIRVGFSHKDTMSGNSFEQLAYGSWDTHSHVGDFKRCPSGNNSRIQVEISAGELGGKVSGSYSGSFMLTAIGGSSGTAMDMNTFSVLVNIQATPEVQVSSLDDLALGSHAGLGNIYAEENFCVYSTSTSGSYSLTVTSTNQDGSGNFFLAGGAGQIPYDLYFTDQASGPGTIKVGSGSLSGFGDSADPFCNGQDNATLSVSVSEQDLQQATSGNYNDSLVILVAPQ